MTAEFLAAGLLALTPIWPPEPTLPPVMEPPVIAEGTYHKFLYDPVTGERPCILVLPSNPGAIPGPCPRRNPGSRYGGTWASGRRNGGQADAVV